MITVYGIRNCDTMKKALAWLENHGVDYRFIDYKGQAGRERIEHWVDVLGWQALVNTRGLTWRKLDEAQRANLDRTRAIALMREHPTLIKRPVVEYGDAVLVGFDAERFGTELPVQPEKR